MTNKKAETKPAPPPTDDAAPGRVSMETVVTEAKPGMTRMVALMRRLLPHPVSTADTDP